MDNKDKKSSSVSFLGPGFRFHPTDEELVRYYLRRKVCGKSFRFDAISEIDIYKVEPWDLPSMSNLKTRDLEWYFFSMLDKKFGNGARTNRATEKGYWKTTGKDRTVYHKSQIVGMKKTLVYHEGRAPKGLRSNWVMHEYRLADMELQNAGINQDAIVLCRVFRKSGSGPKNGEQYGAPFIEEEWEDDELELVPKQEAAEEVDFDDDLYLDGRDLEQILGNNIPSDDTPLPLKTYSADNASYEEETSESNSGAQLCIFDIGEHGSEPEKRDDQDLYDFPASYDTVVKPVRHEYMVESSEPRNFEEVDYLLDEPFLNTSDIIQYGGNGGFDETNDLSNPGAFDTSNFDALEYLTFFDANDDNSQYLSHDLSNMMESEDLISDQAFLAQKNADEGTQQATVSSEQPIDSTSNDAALSSKKELGKCQSDFQYPFIEQASRMLGSFPAPPAFASEFPSKSATLLLNSASSSAHVTAGMIQIRNLTVNGNGNETYHSFSKNLNFNIVLSFGLSRGNNGSANLESRVSILPGKTLSATSVGWLDFIFLWILVLSISFKIGTYICAR